MGPLVGRVDEQRRIAAVVAEVLRGRTQVLLISGEAGVGKSHLAGTVAGQLPTYSHLMLAEERSVPFGAIDRLLDEQLPETADQLVSLRASAGVPTFAIGVVNLIEALGEPFALIIDDLDHLDAGSQEAFWHVIRRLDHVPALFIGTTREISGAFAQRLQQHITVGRRGSHIELSPFTRDEVQALARATMFAPLPPRHLDAVMGASGGIPGRLVSLIGRIRDAGVGSLPDAIDALAAHERAPLPLPKLSPAESAAVLAMALAGTMTQGELTRVCGLLGHDTVDLRELRTAGLIDDDRPALRRPDTAAAIVAAASPADLAAARAALGAVLPGLEGLRHRVAAAEGRQDPQLVAELVETAAGAAGLRDFDVAFRLADWAATLDERQLPLATLYALRSRRAPLLQRLEGRIRALLPGPTRTVLLCAVESLSVDVEDLPAVDGLPLRELDDLLLTVLAHAAAMVFRSRVAMGIFVAPRTLVAVRDEVSRRVRAARVAGAPDTDLAEELTLEGLLTMWMAFGHAGASPTATLRALEGLATSLTAVPAAAAARAATLAVAASVSDQLLRDGAALRHLEELSRVGSAHPEFTLASAEVRHRMAFLAGDWDGAQAAMEPALAAALDDMRDVAALQAQATAAVIPLCRGDVERGRAMLDHVTAVAATRRFSSAMGAVLWSRGWAAVADDDPLTVAESFGTLWHSPLTGHFAGAVTSVLRVRALIALNQVPGARAAREHLLGLECAPSAMRYLSRHCDALLAAAEDRLEAALPAFEAARRALEEWRHSEYPAGLRLMSVLLAEDHGRALTEAGAADPGLTTELRAAGSVLLRAGAAGWHRRLETVLESLPASPDPQAAAALLGLTARETEIADLVLAGLSNREIAASLVVSVRTVEFHVRNILAKLDVTSRVDLRRKLRPGGR